MHTKGGTVSQLRETSGWGLKRAMQFVYAFESIVLRTVEHNDGFRVVERRHFAKVCTARLFSEATNLELDLGSPEKEILCRYPDMDQIGARAIDPADLAGDIVRGGAESIERSGDNRAYLQVDSLTGKTVRITYEDGIGVISVEPIDCELSRSNREFLLRTAVLPEACLAPRQAGLKYRAVVPAAQLGWLFAPSLRDLPKGTVRFGAADFDPTRKTTRVYFDLVPPSGRANSGGPVPGAGALSCDGVGKIRSAVLLGPRWHVTFDPFSSEDEWRSGCSIQRDSTLQHSYSCTPATLRGAPWRPPGCIAPGLLCLPTLHSAAAIRKTANAAAWNAGEAKGWFTGDLGLGRVVLLAAATACFYLGSWVGRRGSNRLTAVVAGGSVALIAVLAVRLHGCLRLATLVPLSNCIVLANWLPLCAAVLIGILGVHQGIPAWRRTTFVVGLALLGSSSVVATSFPASELPPGHAWSCDGVCLQTTDASCSACASATLLAEHGIPANEPEMAELCLTQPSGTAILGVYRGLKIKTRGTRWNVKVFRGPVDQLKKHRQFPVLLPVQVGETAVIGASRKNNIMRGAHHAVVLFGFACDGRAEIGDPSQRGVGRVFWSPEELKAAYLGEGIYLADRYR